MTLADGVRWLKRYWLIALLLVAIGAALQWDPHGPPVSTSEVTPPPPVEVVSSQEEMKESLDRTLLEQRRRTAERAGKDSVIEDHLKRLDDDLDPDERAARLCAIGNLCQQKRQDFGEAAGYYELILSSHPDWPGINGVYHQLIACYTQLGDAESLRNLYRKMVKSCPEESAEFAYAQAALARKL